VALNIFFIVMISNAFNLIDNMDGLCAGVVIVICLFRFFLLASQGYRADADLYAILAAAFTVFYFLTTLRRVFSWAIVVACQPALHWPR